MFPIHAVAASYPTEIQGVWGGRAEFAGDDNPKVAETACESFRKNSQAVQGDIISFGGSKMHSYGGYADYTDTNVSVKQTSVGGWIITDRHYHDGEGGGKPGWKRLTYTISVVDGVMIMRKEGYISKYSRCANPVANVEPSFPCSKAITPDERAICADGTLAQLDRDIANLFKELRETKGDIIARIVRSALTQRRKCDAQRGCILEVQKTALAQLSHFKSAVGRLPERVGECVDTRITALSDRFGKPLRSDSDNGFNGGSAVKFENGGFQISYDKETALLRSQIGDAVRMCLRSVPKDCPPGDYRGRTYTSTNARTGEAWTLQDAQHMCGGA